MRSKNIILIVLVLLIAVFPLLVKSDAEYGGADGEAEVAITEVQPEYEPWMESIWEPPSGEIESLLFALQAAIGAGFIGYYFGFVKGRKENEKAQERVTGQVSTSKS
ncbi:MAG TPA: energy-coupling factor ABC transporter substrate-binding protein [Syntrophaceticus sp.]|jgi:cobalt/nickel transport protein|nr:energy-coupling factor ABC transporter substrate-binding protein [Syntrophaceticus schinkii]MDD4262016.1 energy-coupling factor ABC transporter substrate-binding protein [Syntrophaceticus schinkii]MDD4675751.1 energy-coupling factor ABC transporter substrate-binding protein [Syntrophaceticus schinkii]HHY30371.1 energy-coupling factor ABC transporter substrate-binding protein [Syntrophaceticus sp.]